MGTQDKKYFLYFIEFEIITLVLMIITNLRVKENRFFSSVQLFLLHIIKASHLSTFLYLYKNYFKFAEHVFLEVSEVLLTSTKFSLSKTFLTKYSAVSTSSDPWRTFIRNWRGINLKEYMIDWFLVFNATFSNISAISWRWKNTYVS